MIRKIRSLIKHLLGYNKVNYVPSRDSMTSALQRLKTVGINPNVIFDLGAAKGTWTAGALKVWPGAHYFLFEPLPQQIAQIPVSLKESKNIEIIQAVAGENSQTVAFSISSDLDGSGIYGDRKGEKIEVNMVTLDSINVRTEHHVLLKLDTHGYELPIFAGAKKLLEKTDAIIVEVYGFYVSPTGNLFHEVSAELQKEGFRLFDLVDVMRRPGDQAFWQADAVYLRATHPVFKQNNYS